MEPQFIALQPMKFVGCQESFELSTHDFSGVEKAWQRLFSLKPGSIDNEVDNDQFWGITTDLEKPALTYIAGGLVSAFSDQNQELAAFETPPEQCFAKFEHHGHLMKLGETIHGAFQWLQQKGCRVQGNYILEMYDSRCDPAHPEAYIVDLYIPVQNCPGSFSKEKTNVQ